MKFIIPPFIASLSFLYLAARALHLACDLGDFTTFVSNILGIGGLLLLLWTRKITISHLLLLSFPAYALIRGVFGFVYGYTELEIVQIAAMFGIVCLASYADESLTWKAFIFCMVAQIAITKFHWMEWNYDFANFGALYSWGTFRHAIRYCTFMLVGVIGAWKIAGSKRENPALRALAALGIPLGLWAILQAHSNTIEALAGLWVLGLAVYYARKSRLSNKAIFLMVLGLVIAGATVALLKDSEGFRLDGVRHDLWLCAFTAWHKSVWTVLFGYGVGAWQLLCGTLGHMNTGHPHNEFMRILFEYGIFGICAALSSIAAVISQHESKVALVAFVLVLLSYLTNSCMQYPEQRILISVLAGLTIKGTVCHA